jgi:hypothetical protein
MQNRRFLNSPTLIAISLAIAIVPLSSGPLLAQTSEVNSSQELSEQSQRKLAAEQERLQLQNNNLQLQEIELQLKKRILNLEQQQLGISDTTRPIELGRSGTSFGNLTTVPIESKLLVFQSSSEVAQSIARDVIQVSANSPIQSLVVYSPREFAKLNGYRLYNSIRKSLVMAYKQAGITLPKVTPSGVDGTREIGGGSAALQTSTTALRSVAELLSYFRSEDVININEYTPSSQDFLVAQLVSALRQQKSSIRVYAPSIYLMNFDRINGVVETFLGEINELSILKSIALSQISRISNRQQIQTLNQLNNQADLLLSLLKETDLPADNPKPGSGSSSAGAQIFQLMQGAEISQLLNNRDKRVLVVDLLASGGSTRTRRSLFTTMFTGQSVSYSGGVAVQYFLVNPDNSFAAGDVIYRSSGFKTMSGSAGNR